MPSPPISPTPRRWRSPGTDEPHPDYAALLSSFDHNPDMTLHEDIGHPDWRSGGTATSSEPEQSAEFLSAPGSPQRLVPEIRTTSPSPQRRAYIRTSPHTGDNESSPLSSSPNSGRLFGDASDTAGRMVTGGSEGRRITGPRDAASNKCMFISCQCGPFTDQ